MAAFEGKHKPPKPGVEATIWVMSEAEALLLDRSLRFSAMRSHLSSNVAMVLFGMIASASSSDWLAVGSATVP
jgi:hypothetical protein